jgi:hypothetical protein
LSVSRPSREPDDPLCVADTVSGDPQTLYALEPADAVEDDGLGFMVGGFLMSDDSNRWKTAGATI